MSECEFDNEGESAGVVVPATPITGLSALVSRARSAVASASVSELSDSDRWKLDSVHVGARNDPIMVHPL